MACEFNQRFRIDPYLAGVGAYDPVEIDAFWKAIEIAVFERINLVQGDFGTLPDLLGRQPCLFACLPQYRPY
jgi:hypothetical protein